MAPRAKHSEPTANSTPIHQTRAAGAHHVDIAGWSPGRLGAASPPAGEPVVPAAPSARIGGERRHDAGCPPRGHAQGELVTESALSCCTGVTGVSEHPPVEGVSVP